MYKVEQKINRKNKKRYFQKTNGIFETNEYRLNVAELNSTNLSTNQNNIENLKYRTVTTKLYLSKCTQQLIACTALQPDKVY